MKKNKKIFVIALHLLIGLLAIGIVPISVFLIPVFDFMSILLSVLLIVSLIFCLRKAGMKRGGKIALCIFTISAILLTILGNYCNPYWNSIIFRKNTTCYSKTPDTVLTSAEAKEDLLYAMHYLEKLHPALYGEIPEAIGNRYAEVLAYIESQENITVCELSRRVESIFSILQDGHTCVRMNPAEPHYMKDIYRFNQSNSTLAAVNGIELADLLIQNKELYSFELEIWQLYLLKEDLSSLEGLQYLGILAEEGIDYTYENADGERETYTYYTEDFITYAAYAEYNGIAENTDSTESFVRYEIDTENSLAVLTLDSCRYNEEYCRTLKEMFGEIQKNNIQNVAVDLRYNGGGSSLVADEFIKYLNVDRYNTGSYEWRFGCFLLPFKDDVIENNKYQELLFEGNVYILSAANTFSSAMLFAEYIVDNRLGILIGEAPGNTPCGYGEISMFKLPHSNLLMQISTKEFFRADRENPVNLIEPDIPCDSDEAMTYLYKAIDCE